MRYVDIGVFAHNEQESIPALISDLALQSICRDPGTQLQIHVLCNGCTDQTHDIAQGVLARSAELRPITILHSFLESGKALTWNRFADALPPHSDLAVFMDADIRFRDIHALSQLIDDLQQSTALAVTSRPIKEEPNF